MTENPLIEHATQLRVRDLMTDDVIVVQSKDNLATVRDLMVEHHIRHVPVVDGQRQLVGLISQRDLLRNSLIEQIDVPEAVEQAILERLTAGDLMTHEVDGVAPETDIRDAAQIMLDQKYGCLPVVESGRLIGILTESDFVRLMARGD